MLLTFKNFAPVARTESDCETAPCERAAIREVPAMHDALALADQSVRAVPRVNRRAIVSSMTAPTTGTEIARAAVKVGKRSQKHMATELSAAELAAPAHMQSHVDIGGPCGVPVVSTNRGIRREASRRHIDLEQPGFLRLEDVLTLIPVSRATWYDMVKKGEAPQQIQLFRRAVAWRTQDIRALILKLSASAKAVPDLVNDEGDSG